MKIGDQYSRKDYEYTIVASVPHQSKKDINVYMIQSRKYGQDEVDYFVQNHKFFSPAFEFEGNINN